MQCATMNRRTLTMNWDGLGDPDDDDHFFESCQRISSVVPLDLASSGSDDDDFEDSRMSFVSAISSASIKNIRSYEPPSTKSANIMANYDMWMAEPGDISERRKRLLQGMGLASTKDMLRLASTKITKAVSKKLDNGQIPALKVVENSPPPPPSPKKESKKDEQQQQQTPPPSSSQPNPTAAIMLVRSRSDGDIDTFSARTKQRKEELLGPVSKQRLTRTLTGLQIPSIGICQYSGGVRISSEGSKTKLSSNPGNNDAFGSFFLIKNLDTGKEFIVKEYNEQGMWNKLSDVQTGKQLTMEEFEKSVGYSPVVKELMRRQNRNNHDDGRKLNANAFAKSFRNSKRKGAAFLKNIKGVVGGSSKEHEHSFPEEQKATAPKVTSQWVKARQHGKTYREFTALHMSQEIQAHEGSIWAIRFSQDARYLASAGEDKVIHVWEVQECEVMSNRPGDDLSSVSGTPVHPMAGIGSERPPLAEITPMLSERKKKGKNNKKKGNGIPDYVNVPEMVFSLSDKPVCTFKGHQEDVLDLSWSKSQLLLSSSMDKTVRLWDLETKSCLKMFAHNDYVTCIQFNPVDDDYFMSGSLDGKVRIWNIPNRHVVDWTDLHEMVTAASYTPDGQGAVFGSHQGICRFYSIDGKNVFANSDEFQHFDDLKLEHINDVQMKVKSQTKKLPGFQSQPQPKKITGFQYAPWNPSEVLITSTDSRIRIYNGSELVQKYRGFRNTGSQISASFTPDGKHVISASEDSQVYIWKVEESKNPNGTKKKSRITVQSHEHFQCKDVSVAIPWPGTTRNEPPTVEIHSKRHSKRLTAPPLDDDNNNNSTAGLSSRKHLPPLPKKNNGLDQNASCADEDFAQSAPIDPGIGVGDSFGSSSASIRYGDSPSISASGSTSSRFDNGGGAHGGQTVQATAWGVVIVTASLEGEIRVYQNFGLPLKVGRQANLF
ncbi:WD repeat-containing protein 44 [Phtheirospermum japonicum]|uniref:WD repeat-containing protein 44 n=1 Tax=Phtheirospermum japonicum TaxID=374723 RepID=A0A830BYQ2_9LAMI|nr:WD repeat-containing protein 44 [Phtheirospermum japonicum]